MKKAMTKKRKDKGVQYDEGKLRFDLVPPDGEKELVKVYTFGGSGGKYEDHNWELGMEWSRCIASLKRHFNDFELGDDYDDESKLLHMAHVTWRAMQLLVYQLRDVGTDDRWLVKEKKRGSKKNT